MLRKQNKTTRKHSVAAILLNEPTATNRNGLFPLAALQRTPSDNKDSTYSTHAEIKQYTA